MSDFGMKWPSNERAKAVAEGKCLVGFEATGRHLKSLDDFGTGAIVTRLPRDEAAALLKFVADIFARKAPRDAFAAAWPESGTPAPESVGGPR